VSVPALVESIGVTRRFHGVGAVLADVSLAVARGECVALVGPSGCGKTTLLSLLGALDSPDDGRVLFEGVDLRSMSGSRRARVRCRIGTVFQQSCMIARLPLWENVTYPLVPRAITGEERHEIASHWLAKLGLADRMNARPEQLSGGERRRVGVARALAGEPDLILADEPTSDLDADNAAIVRALFDEYREAGGTLVLATHDPARDAPAARIVRLERGRVVP
jgi:putative ABC transport system ATP-binding protein